MSRTHDTAKLYNVQAVAQETGVKPVTLRAWERRYGIPDPGRTDVGQRLYSTRDVAIIRWLLAQREAGVSISNAVAQWRSLEADGRDPLAAEEPPTDLSPVDDLRERWTAACLAFDERQATAVLTQAFALWAPEMVAQEILQRGMAQLGQMWHHGRITVQQEHFATTLALRQLERLIAAEPPPTRPERLLVGCAPADHHTFSPLLTTFLLRRRGWDVVYLGANVPVQQLEATMEAVRPHLVILTAQRLYSAGFLPEIGRLAAARNVLLGYGGMAFGLHPELTARIHGVQLGRRIDEVPHAVQRLLHNPPHAPLPQEPDAGHRAALAEYRAQRGHIEADLWQQRAAVDGEALDFAALNNEFGEALEAGLRFGSLALLAEDADDVRRLLVSYRLDEETLRRYLTAYRQAAQRYLQRPLLANWLGQLLAA